MATKEKAAQDQEEQAKAAASDAAENADNTAEETAEADSTDTESEEAEESAPEMTREEQLEAKLKEVNDKYLRLYSEFENFRKRTNKEKLELMKNGGADAITALLPVLDDFERAIKGSAESDDVEALREGLGLVHHKFTNSLTQLGLKEIEAVEKPFDLDVHEAVTKIPAPDENLKGKVVDVLEKGYYLNEKVIRYAKVVVGE